ncbi:hypothetical protein ACOSQ2_008764 [Xanthoceras sorbifolium]
MSWLFKSFQSNESESPPDDSPTNRNLVVKDDLSVIGETIGRQLRGVAAFLAPPPNTGQEAQPPPSDAESSASSSQALLGIRNDLVEIGGSFKSGLSLLSSNKAVTEISKFASNLLQFQNQEDDDDGDFDGVPGITEEVVEFVKEISQRPACWTDFPLSLDDDFEMSDAQREHTSTIERLVPSFMDLRIKLCSYLGDNQFWMIYFILLLPRLDEQDFDQLSTPKIIETRNVLMQKLQNKRNEQVETSNTPNTPCQGESIPSRVKEVTEIVNAMPALEIDDEENTEQWLEDEDTDTGIPVNTQKKIACVDDVSFSDLEDDDTDPPRKPAEDNKTTSPSGSNDWVKLNEGSENRGDREKARQSISRDKDSEGESSDWLAVDEFD